MKLMFYETKFLRGVIVSIVDLNEESLTKIRVWMQRTYRYMNLSPSTTPSTIPSTIPSSIPSTPTLPLSFSKIIKQMPSFLNFLWIEKKINLSNVGYQIDCIDIGEWNDKIKLPDFKIRITIPLSPSRDFFMKQSDYDEQNKIDKHIIELLKTITLKSSDHFKIQIFI